MLPVIVPPKDKAGDILVRVVRNMRYAFSEISPAKGKGFHLSPGAPLVPFQPLNAATKQSRDRYCVIQPADDEPPYPKPPLTGRLWLVSPLPMLSVGQAAWEDDGTLE